MPDGNRQAKTPAGRRPRPMKPMVAAAIFLAMAGGVTTASADVSLVFGTYAADKPTATVLKFKPLLRALEESLSRQLDQPVRIRTQITTNYADAIEALVRGNVDFARFGPASYITAKSQNDALALLAMEAAKGRKTFNGVICVHEDSPIQSIADLRGRSFAFGNELSTIGRYLSQRELLNNGIGGGDLARFDYLGRHDRVGMAVANGEFDAGALKESTFKKLRKSKARIRKIASFPNVTKPWIASSALSPRIAAALRRALLDLQDEAALKALKKSGFLEAADSDFDTIRQAIASSQRFAK